MQRRVWTQQEDQILKDLQCEMKGTRWSLIAEHMKRAIPNFARNGKQCRERWINHLQPSISKGEWTADEQSKLIQLLLKHGHKWTDIARQLPGKSQNSVKNYYYSNMRRVLKQLGKRSSVFNNQKTVKSAIRTCLQKPEPVNHQLINSLLNLAFQWKKISQADFASRSRQAQSIVKNYLRNFAIKKKGRKPKFITENIFDLALVASQSADSPVQQEFQNYRKQQQLKQQGQQLERLNPGVSREFQVMTPDICFDFPSRGQFLVDQKFQFQRLGWELTAQSPGAPCLPCISNTVFIQTEEDF